MRNLLFVISIVFALYSCSSSSVKSGAANQSFNTFLNNYYQDRLKLFPLEATMIGDTRYNDQLPIDICDSVREVQKLFFQSMLDSLEKFNYDELNENDQLSFDVLHRDLSLSIEAFLFHENYLPINQFNSLPLVIGQLASGQSAQPFKTVQDYNNWLKRAILFADWLDTSIVYFRKGIDSNIVLPGTLVLKIIPQLQVMTKPGTSDNLFYAPVNNMPASFSDSDRQQLKRSFRRVILEKLIPAYTRVVSFLQNQYLPHSRPTSGINGINNGSAYYKYSVRNLTTTTKDPDEIYQTGLKEVKRIRSEMEKTRDAVGFKGTLKDFLEYLKTDKRFMPFKTPGEVLAAFGKIYATIQPNLNKMFKDTPKTKFEIRQTESFRAASASAEYSQGSADGSRPGIFYIPIVDATQFNITSGMESLFLHEAIPGHHYQISLQQENTNLPLFRRYSGNNSAYMEGWALYCESLGKQLGLFTDPYQYMGALGDEMHRAIRLVVDVALHTKNMSREEAIRYMMDNEAISEQGATSEIERYMAWPAQALSYKIGALKIASLRYKYEKQLGAKFNLAEFHGQLLKDGALPLDVLEKKMDRWAMSVK